MFSKASTNFRDQFSVSFLCHGVNENIVNIDFYFPRKDEIPQNFRHHRLKGAWGVTKSIEHYQRFKESTICSECSLPLISFFDAHIVVAPADIQLGKVVRLGGC